MKILIVDDEIMIRVGLKSAIPWSENGFEIVGDASDGQEALNIFKEKLPDIVLTDIKMPVMDGLQLVEKIKEIDESVKIIILSCLNEFDYVKKALRLGADDYLLKAEFNEKELLDKVIQMRDSLRQVHQEKKIFRDVRYINAHTNRNKLFKELVWGLQSEGNGVIEKLKLFGININLNSYQLIVIKTDDNDIIRSKWEENKDGLFSSALVNIVDEIINSTTSGAAFEGAGEFMAIVNACDKSELRIYEKTTELCEKIKSSVSRYLNITITLGVSNIHYAPYELKSAYNEAFTAVEKRFFSGKGTTIFYHSQDRSGEQTEKVKETLWQEKEFNQVLETLDKKAVEQQLFVFFTNLSEYEKTNPDNIYDKVTELLYLFKKAVSSLGYDINELLKARFSPTQIIKSCHTFDELAEEVRKIVMNTIDVIAQKQSSHVCRPVQRAMEYIDRHYNENISLLVVASHLGLNMSYLSNLFKSEVGENFTDYLTKVRINHAKRLILQRKYKIYEIAQMVGYPNEAYFSTIFKKATGINPKDYDGS